MPRFMPMGWVEELVARGRPIRIHRTANTRIFGSDNLDDTSTNKTCLSFGVRIMNRRFRRRKPASAKSC